MQNNLQKQLLFCFYLFYLFIKLKLIQFIFYIIFLIFNFSFLYNNIFRIILYQYIFVEIKFTSFFFFYIISNRFTLIHQLDIVRHVGQTWQQFERQFLLFKRNFWSACKHAFKIRKQSLHKTSLYSLDICVRLSLKKKKKKKIPVFENFRETRVSRILTKNRYHQLKKSINKC